MRLRLALLVLFGLVTWSALLAQRPFREYPGWEYTNFPLPDDWQEKADWTRARLRYTPVNIHGMYDHINRWTVDYPRSDRHLLEGIRRLTRINTRSVEQPVDLDGSDDIYNWPFVYAVEVGYWTLSNAEAVQLRDVIDRGGFFMCDDFHGTIEWDNFMASFRKVFPDRQVVEIDNKDPIFHVIYDLEDRFQVPGMQYTQTGSMHEYDGYEAKWRGVYDNKGRLVAAICHNMDLGDAWENSDDPRYPERFASLAYRIAVNYTVYHLTH
jgi:hypothetical protein